MRRKATPFLSIVALAALCAATEGVAQNNEASDAYAEARQALRAGEYAEAIDGLEDGLQTIIDNLMSALPQKLYETAYALAIEVAASDVHASQPELRFLEMLRDAFELDRLTAGAIEHSARVRYRRL